MTDSERYLLHLNNVASDVAPIVGTILAQTRSVQATLNACFSMLVVIACILAAVLHRIW